MALINLMQGEDNESSDQLTKVVSLLNVMSSNRYSREQRLTELQKFGADREFTFTF